MVSQLFQKNENSESTRQRQVYPPKVPCLESAKTEPDKRRETDTKHSNGDEVNLFILFFLKQVICADEKTRNEEDGNLFQVKNRYDSYTSIPTRELDCETIRKSTHPCIVKDVKVR